MIEILITSSVLICVVALIRLVFKGRISRRMQYGLWAIVALRLLIPFSFGHSGISILNAAPEGRMDTEIIVWHMDDNSAQASGLADVEGRPDGGAAGFQGGYRQDTEVEGGTSQMETGREVTGGRFVTLGDVLRAVWLFGAALFLVSLIVSNLVFASRLKKNSHYTGLEEIGTPVYVAEGIVSPCLFGIIRPRIYVTPESMSSTERLRHVLTHESSHRRHLDHIWSMVRGLCLAVYWFDPLVWLAAALSRRDCELACDERVIEVLGEKERISYGRTLVDMMSIRRRPGDLLCVATTMTSGKRGARERIKLVAKKQKVLIWSVVAAALIAAVTVGCTFTGKSEEKGGTTTGIPSADITGAVVSMQVAEPNSNQRIYHTLGEGELEELVDIIDGLPESYKNEENLGEPVCQLDITTDSANYMLLTYEDSDQIVSITSIPKDGTSGVANVGEDCVSSQELVTMIRSLICADSPDVLISAAKAAVVDFMGTGWWNAYPIDAGDLEIGSFTPLHTESGDGETELYGLSLYRSYSLADDEDGYSVNEDFYIPCVITIDNATLQYTDFWVPGDGAYYDSSIIEKFPEDIANGIVGGEYQQDIDDMREQSELECQGRLGGVQKISLAQRLSTMTGEDIKYISYPSYIQDLIESDSLARALRDSVQSQVDFGGDISPQWIVTAYLDSIGEDTYSSSYKCLELSAGTQENIVEISFTNAGEMETVFVQSQELYDLVRHSNDIAEYIDQDMLSIFQPQLNRRMEDTLFQLQASEQWTGAESAELLYLVKKAEYNDIFDGTVYVAEYQYVIDIDNMSRVEFVAGMSLDSKERLVGYDSNTYAVAAVADGQVIFTGFLPYDTYYGPEDTAQENGRKAVEELVISNLEG